MAHIEALKADGEQLEAQLLKVKAQAGRANAELTAVARRLAEIAERQGRCSPSFDWFYQPGRTSQMRWIRQPPTG
jgi:hypothetical protein